MKIVALGMLLTASACVHASPSQLEFDVFLGDRRIGTHQVVIKAEGDRREVDIHAEMQVDVLFFTAYEYRHKASETWQGNCLTGLSADTFDDGESLSVRASGSQDRLMVRTASQRTALAGCIRSFAYWDRALLQSDRLLNPQTGTYETTVLSFVGDEPLRFNKQSYGKQRYRLAANDLVIDLWYDESNQWQALQTRVENGEWLRYVRKGSSS